jgi:DNA-binding NarL/FixJ family response regulator
LVAEAAIQSRFTDPTPLLRDAETAFNDLHLPRPAAAVRGMLHSLGQSAPRRRRGDGVVNTEMQRLGVTAREAEVLDLLGDRLTNRQIAQRLYLSPKTVEKHVAALTRKLAAHDRVDLAEIARTRGPGGADQAG